MLIFLALREKRWVLIVSIGLSINLVSLSPWQMWSKQPKAAANLPTTQKLTVMVINLNARNQQHERALAHIKQVNPDILGLIEIEEAWLASLKPVLDTYPFQKYRPQSDNFGIGLFSRLKPKSMDMAYFIQGKFIIPSVTAQFDLKPKPMVITLSHLLPPRSPYYAWHRNEQLNAMARFFNKHQGHHKVLIGDLNLTPWSYYYRTFLEEADLKDSRNGFGLQPSWPSNLWWLRIPIDHIFVSQDVIVHERKVGENIGSDHFSITTVLEL